MRRSVGVGDRRGEALARYRQMVEESYDALAESRPHEGRRHMTTPAAGTAGLEVTTPSDREIRVERIFAALDALLRSAR
jgi:hypothetical protein